MVAPSSSATLSIANRIDRGIGFLLRSRNPDSGVAATRPGDPSGCWTTASAVASVVQAPWFDRDYSAEVIEMAKFLLHSSLRRRTGALRGWPLVSGGRQPSTMATSHAFIALSLAKPFFQSGDDERDELVGMLNVGSHVLRELASPVGGWGVEPKAGPSGAQPRVVSTYLALRALEALGQTPATAQSMRMGVDWMWSIYDSHGFPFAEGQPIDPCSTARAYWALRAADALDERVGAAEAILNYILSSCPVDHLWPLDIEVYVADGAPGQTVFNNNTTAEILEFLIQYGSMSAKRVELVEWFERNQDDDGSWALGANEVVQPEIVTWPTAEAVGALSRYLKSLSVSEVVSGLPVRVSDMRTDDVLADGHVAQESKWRGIAFWIVVAIAVVEAVLLVGIPTYLDNSWRSLPEDFRATIWWASVIAVVLNVVATGIIHIGRRMWNR